MKLIGTAHILVLAVAGTACQPGGTADGRVAGIASSAVSFAAAGEAQPEAEDDLERSLAETHHEIVQTWFREQSLTGRSYEEVVLLAETNAAASKFVECHESTKSPSGGISRIELLSLCLRRSRPSETASAPHPETGEPASAPLPDTPGEPASAGSPSASAQAAR